MSDFTILNLSESENVAPQFGMPAGMDVRFPKRALGCTIGGLAVQRLGPNTRIPFGHKHRDQEELYVVVEGSGRVKIDDAVHELRQWDLVRVGRDTMRNFESGDEGMTLVAFGAPIAEDSDADLVPGWWA